jgi:FkbM family methyltransferase
VIKDLHNLLGLDRLTHIVDIGASPMDGPPSYQPLLEAKLCRVTGFEPDSAACDELNECKGSNETYFPYAIGDGRKHTLYVCANPGWTSLFKPSATALECFPYFKSKARVLRQEPIQTCRLDDLDLDSVDFLKMDIQASELAALRGGTRTLRNVSIIQLEMQFIDLYEGQPTFGEIDLELRSQGFVPHTFFTIKKLPIAPLRFGDDPTRPFNQLVEADLVYTRNFTFESINSDQLKHLALIAHACYGSADLAGRCIMLLEKRGALPSGAIESYIKILTATPEMALPEPQD